MRGLDTEKIRNLLENLEIDPDYKVNEVIRELENSILDSKEIRGKQEKDKLGVKIIVLAYYFCKEDTFFSTPEIRERVFDVLIRAIESFKDEGFIIARLIYVLGVRGVNVKDLKGFDYGEDRKFIEKCISRMTNLVDRRIITHLIEGGYETRIVEIIRQLQERVIPTNIQSPFGRPVGLLRTVEQIIPGEKPREKKRA